VILSKTVTTKLIDQPTSPWAEQRFPTPADQLFFKVAHPINISVGGATTLPYTG